MGMNEDSKKNDNLEQLVINAGRMFTNRKAGIPLDF